MNLTELHPTMNGNHGVSRADFAAADDAYASHRGAIARRSGDWKTNSECYRLNRNEIVGNRRFYTKKKFGSFRVAPFAPRNTSSFIIRAKKCGGIASLVSPVTPDMLKTPVFSPLPEMLVDMAKEEWGVNSYGSMKGFIKLKAEETSENVDVSSCLDVDELNEIHLKDDAYVECFDLRRFELMYPAVYDRLQVNSEKRNAVLESRLNYHDMQIAQLEDEKLMMSDRISLMETEMKGLRRTVQYLETCAGVMEKGSEVRFCDDIGLCGESSTYMALSYKESILVVRLLLEQGINTKQLSADHSSRQRTSFAVLQAVSPGRQPPKEVTWS